MRKRKSQKKSKLQGKDKYGIVDITEEGIVRVTINYRRDGRKLMRSFPINFTDMDENGDQIALSRLDIRVVQLYYKGKKLGRFKVRE